MKYERIRLLRENRELTQEEIGIELNVPQRTYAYYESGERMVPPHVLKGLAIFHDVSVDYILELTDEKTYPKRNRQYK